mgnify:CR=1 FL=1|tara:strand:+ start:1897 stop:2220 length:324 start_codon:yes stop_codon:yes gene_type:complete
MIKLVFKALMLIVIGILICMCMSFKAVAKIRFPDGYIPMWQGQSDTVTTVLNTCNITRITPTFNTEIAMSKGNDPAEYLEVRLTSGEVIKVYEDLEEFLLRIRKNQQ